jgi:hypothetical protein
MTYFDSVLTEERMRFGARFVESDEHLPTPSLSPPSICVMSGTPWQGGVLSVCGPSLAEFRTPRGCVFRGVFASLTALSEFRQSARVQNYSDPSSGINHGIEGTLAPPNTSCIVCIYHQRRLKESICKQIPRLSWVFLPDPSHDATIDKGHNSVSGCIHYLDWFYARLLSPIQSNNLGNLRASVNVKFTKRAHCTAQLSTHEFCRTYKLIKSECKLESYLLQLRFKERTDLTKFRCGFHKLPVHLNRFTGVVTQQLCPLCNHAEISDEFHYLFNCSALSQHRVLYLKKYYFVRPNTLKMHQLFNCNSKTQMYNLAKFVFKYHISILNVKCNCISVMYHCIYVM